MDIKKISDAIRERVAMDVVSLRQQGIEPRLSVILVGGDEASLMYAQTKKNVAERLGIVVEIESLPSDISQTELERRIAEKSHDEKIHGVLLESPFPPGLDYAKALARVDSFKDIDGLHVENMGKLQSGNLESAIVPATPLACLHLMEQWGGSVTGKRIVLVGSGRTVGKPLTMLLMHHGATVIACNADTKNIPEICQKADIIVSAVGKPGLITVDMANADSVIIDVGTALNESGKMVGDVDYEAVSRIAKFVTPVPGGVGMITTGIVFQNLIQAIQLQKRRNHFDLSLNDFIVLASGPTMPGGGGIAAVVGILGATMTSMVFSLTRNLADTDGYERLPVLIESLKALYHEDIDVFNGYLSALKLPKETLEQREFRTEVLQKSLEVACEVPLRFGEISLEILKISAECASVGNKNVISDVFVAITLIRSAVISAFEAIDLNLKSLKNPDTSKDIAERKRRILEEVEALAKQGLGAMG